MVIFSSRRRHTRYIGDWSSDVCSSDLLYAEMRDKAQAIGRKIIEAERDLDQAFATGRIDAPVLHARVGAIAVLQGELRAVHLAAHMAQRPLLTDEQIARYDELRGYGGGK